MAELQPIQLDQNEATDVVDGLRFLVASGDAHAEFVQPIVDKLIDAGWEDPDA